MCCTVKVVRAFFSTLSSADYVISPVCRLFQGTLLWPQSTTIATRPQQSIRGGK